MELLEYAIETHFDTRVNCFIAVCDELQMAAHGETAVDAATRLAAAIGQELQSRLESRVLH